MVRATFDALKVQSSPRQIASKRGKKVGDILGRATTARAIPPSWRADGQGPPTEANTVTVRQTGQPASAARPTSARR